MCSSALLIVAHEVSNVADRSQLANTAKAAKEAIGNETLEAVADRGYFNGEEIKTCVDAGITVTLPKPMTSWAKAEGRFGKEDFVYLAEENVYRCPAGEKLTYRFTSEEHGQKLHRYWTMPELLAQKPMHARSAAPHHALGARGRAGGGAKAARRKSPRYAHAARDLRAPVRHHEDAHGRNSLPDEEASQGRHRDGVVRPHLQSDARLEHRRCARGARSDQGIGAGTMVTPTQMGYKAVQDHLRARSG
jgi:hypothetical protein